MTTQQETFLDAITDYLVGNQALQSIQLAAGKQSAVQWAAVRATTPLSGYPTIPEAKEVLRKFLFGG